VILKHSHSKFNHLVLTLLVRFWCCCKKINCRILYWKFRTFS